LTQGALLRHQSVISVSPDFLSYGLPVVAAFLVFPDILRSL
jgi:hypothetical protein